MEESESKITLTQRRANTGAPSGVTKLKRSKLEEINDYDDEGNSSAGKIVIWVVIIVALAVASYLGIKKYLNKPETADNDQVTETPTPTPDPYAGLFSTNVLADNLVGDLPADSEFTTAEKTVGADSENEYTISAFYGQKYDSFVRLEFTIEGGEDADFPETTATYDTENKQITLNFLDIVEDNSGLVFEKPLEVDGSVLASVTHATVPEANEQYVLELNEDTTFALHTSSDTVNKKIILDIKEIVEPEVSTTPAITTTVTATQPPTTGGVNLTNEFSKNAQRIITETTGNTITLARYNFFDAPGLFTYRLYLEGGTEPYPNVEADLDGTKLTLVISNVKYDGLVGYGTGSTDFASRGVVGVNRVDIAYANNKSTYEFDLDAQYDYRVYINETDKTLVLEVKH